MNNNMNDEIQNKVNELLEYSNEGDIIEKLQEINKYLLNSKILIGECSIYPLWVEAYYYNENKNFKDISCHDTANYPHDQFNIRVHEKQGRGGVDLYLGGLYEDYYLSFLIKFAFVIKNNEELGFFSQMELSDELIKIKEYYKTKTSIIADNYIKSAVYDNNKKIFKQVPTSRVNINKGKYIEEKLAAHWDLSDKQHLYDSLKTCKLFRSNIENAICNLKTK